MEDFTSASNDSVATADTGYEPAASASGDVAGTDTSDSYGTANAVSAAELSINAGWSWEDDGSSPASKPDDDGDIEQLLQDPGLDPARTPGLVTALRNARTAEREHSKALRQYESAFEQFGGVEGAVQSLELVNTLLSGNPQGSAEFLTALYDNAAPVYNQVVTDAIRFNPEYAVAQLQQMGVLPTDLSSMQPSQGGLDEGMLAEIPEHLQATARSLPASVMEDLLLQSEEVRNYHLEREAQMQQLDYTQRQQAEMQYQHAYEQAYQAGREATLGLVNQYEQAHYKVLDKWQPYGPGEENATSNRVVYREVMEGAMAEILGDRKFAQMYRDAEQLMSNAPLRKFQGDVFGGDRDERQARQLAAQFNTRLGQILRERVRERDQVYKGYRAYMQMSGQMPNRREIQGSTVGTPSNRGALGPDGKASPEFLEQLAAQISVS